MEVGVIWNELNTNTVILCVFMPHMILETTVGETPYEIGFLHIVLYFLPD